MHPRQRKEDFNSRQMADQATPGDESLFPNFWGRVCCLDWAQLLEICNLDTQARDPNSAPRLISKHEVTRKIAESDMYLVMEEWVVKTVQVITMPLAASHCHIWKKAAFCGGRAFEEKHPLDSVHTNDSQTRIPKSTFKLLAA